MKYEKNARKEKKMSQDPSEGVIRKKKKRRKNRFMSLGTAQTVQPLLSASERTQQQDDIVYTISYA